MEYINIAFVSDNKYFDYMNIAVNSVISNSNNNLLRFFILDSGIDKIKIEHIKNQYKNYSNIIFEFISIDSNMVSNLAVKTHVSKAAFAKIYMSDLINENKIIYLDCDLIINDDISKLWKEFDENSIVGAVCDPFYNYDNKYFGISDSCKTFNSGVMLLRLDLMRENKSSVKLYEFLCKYNDKTKLHDQAAFNAVFKEAWNQLDLKWNVQVDMLTSFYKDLKIDKKKYFQLYKKPSIIHFTGNSKPWQFRNRHPHKKLFKNNYKEVIGNIRYSDLGIIPELKRVKELINYNYKYIYNLLR